MKAGLVFRLAFVSGMLVFSHAPTLWAQDSEDEETTFAERNLSGPRLGIAIVPRGQNISKGLDRIGIGTTLSQFGWHFEHLVIPKGGGPAFAIQFIPLVGGVEYGKFLFSGTLGLGVRMPNGIEFGMGPNMLVEQTLGSSTSLMLAAGKSFKYSGVSIPVDLVFLRNSDGYRVGIVFGYAIHQSSK